VVAWHLDASNVVNMVLATRFELRPNDVVFVAEQPVTRWNRVVQQMTPSLILSGVNAATN
jgi:polysaccharide export outer membrane protein